MFRRPEQPRHRQCDACHGTGVHQVADPIDLEFESERECATCGGNGYLEAPSDRHFSPGYDGEKPDHIGAAEACAMPACVKSREQREAAADLQDLTYQILDDQDPA